MIAIPMVALVAASGLAASGAGPHFVARPGPATESHYSTGGATWVDFDDDGDLDIFFANGYDVTQQDPTPYPNEFFENQGDGTFAPVRARGVDALIGAGFSSAAVWADFDNDGRLDVFIANQRGQANRLFRQSGDGGFDEVALDSGAGAGNSFSAAWVDVDADGFADLHVANGGLSGADHDVLYRNRGGGSFEVVEGTPITEDQLASCGPAWGDYDNDGDMDLFVPTHVGRDRLYRNDGNWKFTSIDAAPTRDPAGSASGAWGDYDNDGDLDLYVGHALGPANALFENLGDGGFRAVTQGAHVLDAGNTFDADWVDVDLDGDLDLFTGAWSAAPALFLNDEGAFRQAVGSGLDEAPQCVAGSCWGDYDADGDLDLLIANWPNRPGPAQRNALFENRAAPAEWVALRLQGGASNRSAIGARITLIAAYDDGTRRQIREITCVSGWRSQNDLAQHFGLAPGFRALHIEIRWPSGRVQTIPSVEPRRLHTIVEPA